MIKLEINIFSKNKNPVEQGDVVIMSHGYCCESGIVISTDKRKSRIRFIDGKEMFVSNKKISIVYDTRLKNNILRSMNMEGD